MTSKRPTTDIAASTTGSLTMPLSPANWLLVTFAVLFGAPATAAPTSPGTPVSQATYDAIVHYTRYPFFSQGHTPGTSFAPCSSYPYNTTLVKSIDNRITDTQAQIFRDDNAKEFILSVPGTASLVDAISDIDFTLIPFISPGVTAANCPGCLVHMGFLDAWNSIGFDVIRTLKTGTKAYPGYRVTVSGYSLGGAIAALGGFSTKASSLPISAVYTFGEPRTGNPAFANSVDKMFGGSDSAAGSFFRVTHFSDPVPQLPPQFLGSRHHRTEYFESQNRTFSAATTYQCMGQESPTCNNKYSPVQRDVNAHLIYSGITSSGTSSCG